MTPRFVASKILVGTVGWSIPHDKQSLFPAGASHLARYAMALPAVEINSTFYRPHLPATFERWASSVPQHFRFSFKIPRAITHDQRLVHCARPVKEFIASLAPMGLRVGCLLVQLPPSLPFDARVARAFLSLLRKRFDRAIALEPRHASWFQSRADRLLSGFEVARVAADPPLAEEGDRPGGWSGFAYFRLHGSPRTYYSSYENGFLDVLANDLKELRRRHIPSWCIFDNTARGAAINNALSLIERLPKLTIASRRAWLSEKRPRQHSRTDDR